MGAHMYLGLDLGTSSVKAVLIGSDQALLAEASAPLDVSRPRDGWSEQDPAAWTNAANAAVEGLRRDRPSEVAAVAGIGLSGQMHGATLLDAADRPLRPAMLWNDTRAAEEANALDAEPMFREFTGNIVFPGFTAPKLLWVRHHEPRIFEATRKVLLPKDYLRLWLTGEAVSEMSDAAGTAWLDVRARSWSAPLLAATGLTVDAMPDLVEGTDVSGRLRADLAAAWGIATPPVVAGGAGDNAAAAIGLGVLAPQTGFVSLGTSGVLFVPTTGFAPDPGRAVHAFCHALPETWHHMGVILAATDALNWVARLTGQAPGALVEALGPTIVPPGPAMCLPYFSGERTPHNDAQIRGAFIGVGQEDDARAVTRAVLEGVAFALRDCLAALEGAGAAPERLVATGGGARSDYWLSLLASVLGRPIDLPEDGDFGAAFGAARLGLIAAEGADPAAVATPPPIARSFEPDPALSDAVAAGYARFRALYPALKDTP